MHPKYNIFMIWITKRNKPFFLQFQKQFNLRNLFLRFRMDLESVDTKPSVQESIGIFQLIDQLETAVECWHIIEKASSQ
jgi:hypothetical protein